MLANFESFYFGMMDKRLLVGWLIGWILWLIKLCRLFNTKSIFKPIINSISNNSV